MLACTKPLSRHRRIKEPAHREKDLKVIGIFINKIKKTNGGRHTLFMAKMHSHLHSNLKSKVPSPSYLSLYLQFNN